MSLSTVAGQIAALSGKTRSPHPPMQPPAAPIAPMRKPLINHPTRSATTIHGRAAIAFGSAFVGVGVFIILVATGIIPTEEGSVHAPLWVIGVCGGVFAVPGLWVVQHGVVTLFQDARVRRMQEQHPDSPWMYDYPWSEHGTTYSDARTIRQGLFGLLVIAGLATPGHYIAMEGAWFLWFFMAMLDVGILIAVIFIVRAIVRRLQFGRSHLRFQRFPFHVGGKLDVTWIRPRGMVQPKRMTFTLRFVEEKFERHGKNGERVAAYALHEVERTVEPSLDRDEALTEIPLSFDLPTGLFETRLRDRPPRYWELECRCPTAGVDYVGRFVLPVYETRGRGT